MADVVNRNIEKQIDSFHTQVEHTFTSGYAWVTLATNDSYSLGALVLAHSLRKAATAHKTVVLITPAVSQPMREQLQTVFDVVRVVDVLDSKDEAHLALMQRPELGITFTKMHCWRLVEFDKCVFLDADTLVVRNCDELFEREEFSAAPDVSWPDCFNSGVFVYKPSVETFNKLVQFAVEKGSFDGGDQGLLNQFFSEWATEDIKKHLPFVYNLTLVAAYSYIPAFKHYGAQMRIVHFIGTGKPWLHQLDPATRTVTPTSGSEHLAPLLQQWWDLFCEKVHPGLDKSLESSNDGMCHPPVAACSNSLPIALTDDSEPPRLSEPCTPYREKHDFRQCNLPYQPFHVKGSSGELLDVEFFLASVAPPTPQDVCQEEQQRREGDRPEEKVEREKEKESDAGGSNGTENGYDGESEETTTDTVHSVPEGKSRSSEEEAEDTEKQPPGPFDYDTFFPDETCVNNYLEQNVRTYQLFDRNHNQQQSSHNSPQHAHHDSPPEHYSNHSSPQQQCNNHTTLIPNNSFNSPLHPDRINSHSSNDSPSNSNQVTPQHSSTADPQPEDVSPPLPRFLTIPENDKRQMGNTETQPSADPPPQDSPRQEKRELTKSKSVPYLLYDVTEVPASRSVWKSQPCVSAKRKYSMPRLRPILPRRSSLSKSEPSMIPKVTLYTEFLISSEYKDPVDLPEDKVGFVETQIHKRQQLGRTKSAPDVAPKFGPLPYVFSPEVEQPRVLKKTPLRHTDNGLYDLSECKRQMGNKPKPVVPGINTKAKGMKKRKSREVSSVEGGREKMLNRERRRVLQGKGERITTPRNVSGVGNRESVEEILKRLRELSKKYEHFFGEVLKKGDAGKNCKNVMVQVGEECEASELFWKSGKSLGGVTSRGTQTGIGSGFRQFRDYVNEKSKRSQKGLLGIQDLVPEGVKIAENGSGSNKSEVEDNTAEGNCIDNDRLTGVETLIKEKNGVSDLIPSEIVSHNVEKVKSDQEKFPSAEDGHTNGEETSEVIHKNGVEESIDSSTAKDSEKNSVEEFPKDLANGRKYLTPTTELSKTETVSTSGAAATPENESVEYLTPTGELSERNAHKANTTKDKLHAKLTIQSTDSNGTVTSNENCCSKKGSDHANSIKYMTPTAEENAPNLAKKAVEKRAKNLKRKKVSLHGKERISQNGDAAGKTRQPPKVDEMLCVPDFDTPRSSRVVLPTATSAATVAVEAPIVGTGLPTSEAYAQSPPRKSRKLQSVAVMSNGGSSVPAVGEEPLAPCRGNALPESQDEERKRSGIAGAIAQLSLDAGSGQGGESATAAAAHQEYLRRQNWETGNMDYMGRDSFNNIWSKICQTLEGKEPVQAVLPEPSTAPADTAAPLQTTKSPQQPPETVAAPPKCPEFIETLPSGESAVGPVEDDEIIFSKADDKQSLTNVVKEEEGESRKVKLSDILGQGKDTGLKGEEKQPECKTETVCQPVLPPLMVKQVEACTTVAIPSPPIIIPGMTKEEAKRDPIPLPPPESPTTVSAATTGMKDSSISPAVEAPATKEAKKPEEVPKTGEEVPKVQSEVAKTTPEDLKAAVEAEKVVQDATSGAEMPKAGLEVAITAAQSAAPAEPEAAKAVLPVKEGAEVPQPAPETPKSAPEAPQSAPEAPQSAPEAPQSAPEAPKSAPEAPQSPPKAPEAPQSAPEAPKSAPEAPQSPPKAPEAPQPAPEAPQSPTEAPKSAPEAPKPAPEATKPAPEASQPPPEAPKTTQDATAKPSDAVKQQPNNLPEQASEEKKKLRQTKDSEPQDTVAKASPENITAAAASEDEKAKAVTSDEGKQKKGVFTKILEMVGVAPKEKIETEAPKSVFYDGAQQHDENSNTVLSQTPVGALSKQQPEESKQITPPSSKVEIASHSDAAGAVPAATAIATPTATVPPASATPESNSTPDSIAPHPPKSKSPTPKLTLPQKPPQTAITTPTPPPQPEPPLRRNSALLKVDDSIPETPPVGEPEGTTKGNVMSEVEEIIGKAKSEVESRLGGDEAGVKILGMMGAGEEGEVEELRVTSEEERMRHKGEVVKSKLSEQILKAIPPPRRKAISEAAGSTSGIPKGTGGEQKGSGEVKGKGGEQKGSGEVKSKGGKPSSIPVPPPRSRGKPMQPSQASQPSQSTPSKGRGKK